jgi:hypothetical protein
LFNKLEKDKEGYATLYLIYKHIRKSNFDTTLDTLIPTILQGKTAKGKRRRNRKGKGQGLVLKKVKTKLINNNSDLKVKLYILTLYILRLICILKVKFKLRTINVLDSKLFNYLLPLALIANYLYYTYAQGKVKSKKD